MEGIVTGIVKQNWDEDHRNMVRVEYYLGEAGVMETVWMPVMMPYAGPDYGLYLLPEVGAEVVVGFRFNNRNSPFVLGSLLGNANAVPNETSNEDNSVRVLKTKAGFRIAVDEKENLLSFTDPGGQNTISWSTEEDHGLLTLDIKEKLCIRFGGEDFLTMENEKVTFAHKVTIHGEEGLLEMEKGLDVKCGQAMTLQTDQNMTLKGRDIELAPEQEWKAGGMKAQITPSRQMELKAEQLKIEGTSVALSAQASGKLEASGIMEIKGAMLKLN